ncbi:MAG: UbiD family decarboxylase [Syntrophales bacterium]|nr:UbiD family decarboxylase [Syntrophales bacterium]
MDLRDAIKLLEKEGRLITIDQEVDWYLEACAITGMMYRVNDGRYAVLYNNVKDYYPDKGRLIGNLWAGSRRRPWERVALFMGLPKDITRRQFLQEVTRRERNPVKPLEISAGDAPCKEIIKMGKEANLLDLPITFSHGTDGGRYLTILGVINQDPDTGWTNIGNYRWMVKSPRRGAALWQMGQHGPTIYYMKYEARGNTMPFCIALGGDPLFFTVACAPLPAGYCEYDFVGALRDKPLEVVRAETNNLLVPADAEVIIEGEVRPGERTDEGPFGEYSGYTQGRNISPIFRINCITMRKNPILPAHTEGIRWNDECGAIIGMETGYLHDCERFGLKRPKDWWLYPQAYSLSAMPFEATCPEDLKRLAQVSFYSKQSVFNGNLLIPCDPDVDTSDIRDVFEQVALNYDPRTVIFSGQDVLNSPLNFFTDADSRAKYIDGGKRLWDATTQFKPWSYPKKVSFEHAYPLEVREKVAETWSKLGFDQDIDRKEPEML